MKVIGSSMACVARCSRLYSFSIVSGLCIRNGFTSSISMTMQYQCTGPHSLGSPALTPSSSSLALWSGAGRESLAQARVKVDSHSGGSFPEAQEKVDSHSGGSFPQLLAARPSLTSRCSFLRSIEAPKPNPPNNQTLPNGLYVSLEPCLTNTSHSTRAMC